MYSRLGDFKSMTRRWGLSKTRVVTLISVLAIAALISTITTMMALAAPAQPQWLHVEGNRIVNEDGQTVQLRGVNVERWSWLWPSGNYDISYERKAIQEVTSAPPEGWGGNVILIPVASGPINRNDSTFLGFMDEFVEIAKANGAYTFFVYRYAEPNDPHPNMPDQAAQEAMAKVAKRYANEPAVIYGLQVEPHNESWATLKPRFTSMIDAIQAENPRAMIAVPGTQWGRYVEWMLTDPIERDNIFVKSHVYSYIDEINATYDFPGLAAKYPVLLGEFGVGTRMDQVDVDYLLNLAESLGMSWTAWLFQDVACPCLLSDSRTLTPSAYGVSIRDRLQEAARNAASTKHNFYDDAIQGGNWSWAANVASTNSGPVLQGSKSLSATFLAAWGGVSIYSGSVSTSPYTHLQFQLNPSNGAIPNLSAYLHDAAGAELTRVRVTPTAGPNTNGWYNVSIPLKELGAVGKTITRVTLQEASGNAQPVFYLDDVKLVDLNSAVPNSPNPTPSSGGSTAPPPAATPTSPAPTVSATAVPSTSGRALLTVGSASGKPGEIVDVPIRLTRIAPPGASGFTVQLSYDETSLEFVEVLDGDVWTDNAVNSEGDGLLRMVNAVPYSVAGDSVIATLRVRVLDRSPGEVDFHVNHVEMVNKQAESLPVDFNDGSVLVSARQVTSGLSLQPTSVIEAGAGLVLRLDSLTDAGTGATLSGNKVRELRAGLSYSRTQMEVLSVSPLGEKAVGSWGGPSGANWFDVANPSGYSIAANMAFAAVRLTGPVGAPVEVEGSLETARGTNFEEIALPDDSSSVVATLRRGDILPDGEVNILDVVAGMQYLAGVRTAGTEAGQVNLVNFASIRHDAGNDRATVSDLVVLTQYLAGERDESS